MVRTGAIVRAEGHITPPEMRGNFLEDGTLDRSLGTSCMTVHSIKPQLCILLVQSFCVVPALGEAA